MRNWFHQFPDNELLFRLISRSHSPSLSLCIPARYFPSSFSPTHVFFHLTQGSPCTHLCSFYSLSQGFFLVLSATDGFLFLPFLLMLQPSVVGVNSVGVQQLWLPSLPVILSSYLSFPFYPEGTIIIYIFCSFPPLCALSPSGEISV